MQGLTVAAAEGIIGVVDGFQLSFFFNEYFGIINLKNCKKTCLKSHNNKTTNDRKTPL
jgi:hypothetical protein